MIRLEAERIQAGVELPLRYRPSGPEWEKSGPFATRWGVGFLFHEYFKKDYLWRADISFGEKEKNHVSNSMSEIKGNKNEIREEKKKKKKIEKKRKIKKRN